MEILPGVHQIPIVYHGRPLNLYLIMGEAGGARESMLMDTGDADIPAAEILPYFAKIGFDPRELTYILLTHPDIDHTGGVYGMRAAAPRATFLCGTTDREQIETPEGLGRIRARAHYYWHGIGPDDVNLAAFVERAGGAGQRLEIARTLAGGEVIDLGGRELRILHLPGHSEGHLGVYLPTENAAIIGDAVHGTANRFLDGRAAFACTYMYVDAYLGTIAQLRGMRLDRLYSCHWPDGRDNATVNAFLDESRAYAIQADRAIYDVVRTAGATGLTLKEVCLQAKPKLGDWPAEKDMETRSMACGHLQRLAGVGLIRTLEGRPTRYAAEAAWMGLR